MRIDILTLFPEMCERVFMESITGRAVKAGHIEINAHNIRDYSENKQRSTDDSPYGGGEGMLLTAEPVYLCYEALCGELNSSPHLIYMTPQGKPLKQKRVIELSKLPAIAILCGHYEGIDERVIDELSPEEISIGDFVVTGGELPALMLADAIARMCEGVLSSAEGFMKESHYEGLLEYPQYTRPAVWRGREAPAVLLSGHHANVEAWRREQSLIRTRERRPDLMELIC
ncbi:MAG: tRNA (guanosine(37)-N1)-methyltransferase TrmD [Oscillospiraceae bacterium]|nr:tRNA (guanosine(37)-N1)-methyltransferase TrmD [Oscillospiraceae bacterium]